MKTIKIILSKKVATIVKIVVFVIGLSLGYFLNELLDGWKLWVGIFLFICVGYIILFKFSLDIYERGSKVNKNENNKDRF